MLILFILTAIIVSSLQWTWPEQIGGTLNADARFMNKMVPFNNPFSTRFFHQKEGLFKVYTNQTELHRSLLVHTVGPHIFQDSKAPLNELNDYSLDFVVDTELNVSPKYMGKKIHSNLRFICALYAPSILLIAPNDKNIIDLGDIKHYSCKVTIAVRGGEFTEHYQALVQLLSAYGEQTVKNVQIIHLNEPALLNGYGTSYMIYADLAIEKNQIIRALTDRVPSHLVSFKKINAGSYHITYPERPFYRRYPYYNKKMIDTIQLRRYYPQLTSFHNRDLYYPTINTRYVLLCHDKIPKPKVEDVLHKILRLMLVRWNRDYSAEQNFISKLFKGTTVTDISHMSTAIALHDGAKQVYRDIHLHFDSESTRNLT